MPSRVLIPASCLPSDGTSVLITSKGSGTTQAVDSFDGPLGPIPALGMGPLIWPCEEALGQGPSE